MPHRRRCEEGDGRRSTKRESEIAVNTNNNLSSPNSETNSSLSNPPIQPPFVLLEHKNSLFKYYPLPGVYITRGIVPLPSVFNQAQPNEDWQKLQTDVVNLLKTCLCIIIIVHDMYIGVCCLGKRAAASLPSHSRRRAHRPFKPIDYRAHAPKDDPGRCPENKRRAAHVAFLCSSARSRRRWRHPQQKLDQPYRNDTHTLERPVAPTTTLLIGISTDGITIDHPYRRQH